MTKTRRGLVAGAALLGLTVAGLAPLAVASAPDMAASPSPYDHPAELFGPAPTTAARAAVDTTLGTPKRARYISLRTSLLPKEANGEKLDLGFFTDAAFEGTVEHVDKQALFTSWSGPLTTGYGSFVVTQAAGRFQVTASSTQGSFTVNLTKAGLYQAAEVAQPHLTGDDTDIDPAVSAASGRSTRSAPHAATKAAARTSSGPSHRASGTAPVKRHSKLPSGDDGSVEDILVAYSSAAAAAYGGTAGITAEAAKNIAYTNAAYAASGVKTTARLVAVVPTKTPEIGNTGIPTDLNRLTRQGDHKYDDVLRKVRKYHADDTVLLTSPPPGNSGLCGIANLKKGQPADTAFAVVSTGFCTDGVYSFPHELGHNQGADHDPWTLSHPQYGGGGSLNNAQYRYGHGFVAPDLSFYTVMAYDAECYVKMADNCVGLDTFSNPGVAYNGETTGDKLSFVAKLISKTRHRVASHQQSTLYPRSKLAFKPSPRFKHGRVHVVFRGWFNGGVTSKFQWYLDGIKIKHAKGATYQPRKQDRGHQLSVVVTGKKRTYAPVLIGSGARAVK